MKAIFGGTETICGSKSIYKENVEVLGIFAKEKDKGRIPQFTCRLVEFQVGDINGYNFPHGL